METTLNTYISYLNPRLTSFFHILIARGARRGSYWCALARFFQAFCQPLGLFWVPRAIATRLSVQFSKSAVGLARLLSKTD